MKSIPLGIAKSILQATKSLLQGFWLEEQDEFFHFVLIIKPCSSLWMKAEKILKKSKHIEILLDLPGFSPYKTQKNNIRAFRSMGIKI